MAIKKRMKKAIKDSIPIDGPPKPIKLPKKYNDFDLAQATVAEYNRGYNDGQHDPPMVATREPSDKERQEEATAAKIVADRLMELRDLIDYHNKIAVNLGEQYRFLKSTSPQSALNINRSSSPAIPGSVPPWCK